MKEKIKQVLATRKYRTLDGTHMTPAAVLIPIFCKQGQDHILLTKRTQSVRHHKGQISFPGGVQHHPGESLEDTAKRETFEEIGVKPEHIEILGRLDQTRTVTNYIITPFVGLIPHPYPFVINSVEVEEIIEVPLSFLLDSHNITLGRVQEGGFSLETEHYRYGRHVIWGATARIIRIFRDTLGKELQQMEGCLQ